MLMNGKWTGTLAMALAAAVGVPAQTWKQVGPPGGTVISLEADPRNEKKLYLGTSDGHVFQSSDQGSHWQLLSRIGNGQDDVITHILVDPRDSNHLYASTWTLYSGGGGVYASKDAGRTWKVIGLDHETVRALAQAPTNHKLLVAGSLTGVYRSKDDGHTWEKITPSNHPDLKNFDSVAFDPNDENIIYAGTYHLAWKTSNGGKEWFPIHAGMIDDSDVMSIVVDPQNPQSVHATACSGIYHSVNGAQQWTKYQGIPFAYRRTQLIRQDPSNPQVLYAGTTSGLWKTTNEKDFKRLTPVDWVVNAVLIDPKNTQRIIIGTEREGVQISENGGESFAASNNGFHHQHILDFAMDTDHPERVLVVLTFDTNAFLATKNGGATWSTLGGGLKRTDLRHVYAAPTGWWASLANGGLVKYDETAGKWVKAGLYVPDAAATPASLPAAKGKKGVPVKRPAAKAKGSAPKQLAFQVNDLLFTGDAWFAATAGGVLVSRDRGATWKSPASESFAKQPAQALQASLDGSQVWAVSQRNLLYSQDSGKHWEAKELPFAAAGNLRLSRVNDSTLFIASNMGLYASQDAGRNWTRADVRELSFQDVAGSGNALVVSLQKHGLMASRDAGKSWQRISDPPAEGFFPRVEAQRDGSVIAVSATEGLLSMEPASRSVSSGVGTSMLVAPGDLQKPQR